MQYWKKNIIVRAIKIRMQTEGRAAEEILEEYHGLTEEEKEDILSEIGGEGID